MPFTFAHPAAVLPLRRSRLLLTAPLIIGSVVPDVPYFFPPPLGDVLGDTHSLYASFVICLPLGVALLVLTVLLREPLTVLLSARARWICLRSIERFLSQPLHWPLALLSILIGTWTHLAWDSFTHPGGWTAQRVEALNAPVWIFGWQTELSHLLQYLSSVFGLVIMALWLRRVLARAPEPVGVEQLRPRARWPILVGIGFAAVLVGGLRALALWQENSYYHLGYLLSTRMVGWFAALYLAAGILVMFNRRDVPEPAA